MIEVKICGLSTADTMEMALGAGADWIGLVHFPPSPRHVDLDAGRALSAQARGRAGRAVLLVDPDDATVARAVDALDPDLIQLHGSERPARVRAIRSASGRPVMKAVGVAAAADLDRLAAYAGAADRVLIDAKPPPGARVPGGNGRPFDWDILAGRDLPRGWMLSGGLSPANVAEAIARTGARAIDVSSGVERAPGVKDAGLIRAFVAAARRTAGADAALSATLARV